MVTKPNLSPQFLDRSENLAFCWSCVAKDIGDIPRGNGSVPSSNITEFLMRANLPRNAVFRSARFQCFGVVVRCRVRARQGCIQ